jgi:hypothetical protein
LASQDYFHSVYNIEIPSCFDFEKKYLHVIKNGINYVIENHHKFLLLLFVFIIIYFVDYITYINTILYAAPAIPGLPNLNNQTHRLPNVKNPKKKGKGRRV